MTKPVAMSTLELVTLGALTLTTGCAVAGDDAEDVEVTEETVLSEASAPNTLAPFPVRDAVVLHDAANFPHAAVLFLSDKPGLCARLQQNRLVRGERRLDFELGRAEPDVPAPDDNPYVLPLTKGLYRTVPHTETSAGPFVGRWTIGTLTRYDNQCDPTGSFASRTVRAGGGVYASHVALPPASAQGAAMRGGYAIQVGGKRYAALFQAATYCPLDVFAEPPAPTCIAP